MMAGVNAGAVSPERITSSEPANNDTKVHAESDGERVSGLHVPREKHVACRLSRAHDDVDAEKIRERRSRRLVPEALDSFLVVAELGTAHGDHVVINVDGEAEDVARCLGYGDVNVVEVNVRLQRRAVQVRVEEPLEDEFAM
jgi:hypothetical protein